jgi:dihydroxyacetone kinase
MKAACEALISAEEQLTEMDRITGDGDLGSSMKRAALAVLAALDSYSVDDVPKTLKNLAWTLQRELAGSSGPLYGVFFLRCGNILGKATGNGIADWANALHEGVKAISELGGAKPGDRTMLDSLDPFVRSLEQAHEGNSLSELLLAAVQEAERGAHATANMTPRMGRSSYLGDRVVGHPDPGAEAIAIWLRAVASALLHDNR